jgi:hypothetical protein
MIFNSFVNPDDLQVIEVNALGGAIQLDENCKSNIFLKTSILSNSIVQIILPNSAYLGKRISFHAINNGMNGQNKVSGSATQFAIISGNITNPSAFKLFSLGNSSVDFVYIGLYSRGTTSSISDTGWKIIGNYSDVQDSYRITLGNAATTGGSLPIAIGTSANCSGNYGIAIGLSAYVSNSFAVSIGPYAYSFSKQKLTLKANSNSGLGYTQAGITQLHTITTSTTPLNLLADVINGVNTSANFIALANNNAYYCQGQVVARDYVTGDVCNWDISFTIKRGATASSIASVGAINITKLFGDTATSAWTITTSFNTTFGGIDIIATGEASKTIHWVANIHTNEVI